MQENKRGDLLNRLWCIIQINRCIHIYIKYAYTIKQTNSFINKFINKAEKSLYITNGSLEREGEEMF